MLEKNMGTKRIKKGVHPEIVTRLYVKPEIKNWVDESARRRNVSRNLILNEILENQFALIKERKNLPTVTI
jgi:hypothetical protein